MHISDALIVFGCLSGIALIEMDLDWRSDNSFRFGFMSGCIYSGCIVILANVL
jgi:hypothetical protein